MSWNLHESIRYYRTQGAPEDQTALVGLLQEIQLEHGGAIPTGLLTAVAEELGIKESFLLALIRRMPRLRLADTHVLEVCAGPNCGKAAKLAAFAETLERDAIRVKFVPCMRQCGKGPNIKWDGQIFNDMTDEKLLQMISKNKA